MMEETMTPNRSAIRVLAVACLAFVTSALLLTLDGCSKKKAETSEETAQTQAPSDEAAGGAAQDTVGARSGTDVVTVGSHVTLHYRGTLSDGSVFDESKEGQPFVFVAGTGQVIPGFDNAVLGMKVGEEKTFTIPAAEAYGPRNPRLIRNIPRSSFAEDFSGKDGDEITIRNASGLTLRGVLVSQTPDSLLIDFNGPLAGEDLTFDIRVMSIE
jgi:peptidylprolyl isomerase